MVFWTTYPISNVFHTFLHNHVFSSQVIEKDPIESPTGRSIEIGTPEEVCHFLRSYFGDPPRTPILELVIDPMDHLLIVRDQADQIVGTVRYHYIGRLSHPIYLVDAFCIHPTWRGKGVGDYLLTELHRYANQHNIPYALFLKEGRPLSIFHPPIYTGWYAYRSITEYRSSPFVIDLDGTTAYRIMDIYKLFQPNMLLIRNEHTPNQIWKWFKKDQSSILIGIQDTFQRIKNEKMGWITTWIESPIITEEIRGAAVDAIADHLFPIFDWLWINEKWKGTSTKWKRDGAFHWYTYQWATSLSMDKSYGIMM
jgi:GNAT superfamily N-acetyltransferase